MPTFVRVFLLARAGLFHCRTQLLKKRVEIDRLYTANLLDCHYTGYGPS